MFHAILEFTQSRDCKTQSWNFPAFPRLSMDRERLQQQRQLSVQLCRRGSLTSVGNWIEVTG